MKIALAGNPNSGKTTLFNALTGKVEKVGNWAGVTVDKKEAILKKFYSNNEEIDIIDLPGAYSMSPYTEEESITRDFVMLDKPDVIINIVDSSNLSRSLFFTSQLLELDIPVVIALNKKDIASKKNIEFDISNFENILNCPMILISATKEEGLSELMERAINLGKKTTNQKPLAIKGLINSDKKIDIIRNDKIRFEYINEICEKNIKSDVDNMEETISDKIDKVVAHRIFGIPIFIAIMWIVFAISQAYVGPLLAETLDVFLSGGELFNHEFAGLYGGVSNILEAGGVNELLSSLLLEGIIGGFIAIIGFLPLIMVLFFLLTLLEDCGYMARVAIILDAYFKKIGLSGKSIIPMIIGSGCAIPGIMATRTIKNNKEKNLTAMLTPFIPCGAKLPIIALITSVFFVKASWVGPMMYLLAIVLIILSGLFIKSITGAEPESVFIMEIPEYKWPSIKRAFITMLLRAKDFIVKAGTIILVCNAIVWFMQTYNWQLQPVGELEANTSILATIATPIAFLFIPLGFGVWQFAAAAVTGFIAKENVVGTLAVTFSLSQVIDESALSTAIGNENVLISVGGLTAVSAMAFMVFNLFSPPCFAAIGAMNSEIKDKKWLRFAILFQFVAGYLVALVFYQLGTIIFYKELANGFILAIIVLIAAIIYGRYLVLKQKNNCTN